MEVSIENNAETGDVTVWLNEQAIAFSSLDAAQAYVATLQARLEAARHSFIPRQARPSMATEVE
jgi:hypothetical protein